MLSFILNGSSSFKSLCFFFINQSFELYPEFCSVYTISNPSPSARGNFHANAFRWDIHKCAVAIVKTCKFKFLLLNI